MVTAAALMFWFAVIATPDGQVAAKGDTKSGPKVYSTKEACEKEIAVDRKKILEANPGTKEGVDFVLACIQDPDFEKQALAHHS